MSDKVINGVKAIKSSSSGRSKYYFDYVINGKKHRAYSTSQEDISLKHEQITKLVDAANNGQSSDQVKIPDEWKLKNGRTNDDWLGLIWMLAVRVAFGDLIAGKYLDHVSKAAMAAKNYIDNAQLEEKIKNVEERQKQIISARTHGTITSISSVGG